MEWGNGTQAEVALLAGVQGRYRGRRVCEAKGL